MKSFMKNQILFFKRNYINLFSVLFILTAMFTLSCGGSSSQDKVREEQLKEIKAKAKSDLNALINDVEERIEYLDEEIENASGEAEQQLQDSREELEVQKERINDELDKIEEASLDTWNDVIDKTSEVTNDVRAKTNEISREVRDLLEE